MKTISYIEWRSKCKRPLVEMDKHGASVVQGEMVLVDFTLLPDQCPVCELYLSDTKECFNCKINWEEEA